MVDNLCIIRQSTWWVTLDEWGLILFILSCSLEFSDQGGVVFKAATGTGSPKCRPLSPGLFDIYWTYKLHSFLFHTGHFYTWSVSCSMENTHPCRDTLPNSLMTGTSHPSAICHCSVQLLSLVWLFVTPWTAAHQASLSIHNSWVYSNSCPSSQWGHPTISSSVIPFSYRLQTFPALGAFPMSQFFTSGGQNIGVSASASVLPRNIQDWFSLGWTGWISLLSKGLSKSLLQHHSSKASILQCSAFFTVQLSHPHMATGKTTALNRQTSVGNIMSLLLICCLGWP